MAMAVEGELGWMAEVAGEELAKLEAAHPGPRRFGPLKAELKRLTTDPSLDAAVAPAPLASTTTSSSSQFDPVDLRIISTQESTSRKRSWGCHGDGGGGVGRQEGRRRRCTPAAKVGKDRAEMAIERAVRCLERIRAFKASLLRFTD